MALGLTRIAFIGVGLIGGSLALAVRRGGMSTEIVGYTPDHDELSLALELGVIDIAAVSARDAVRGAKIVVVAVPILQSLQVFDTIRDALEPEAIITDVGSVKACVIGDARAALGSHFPRFIPGHPIAGIEKSGVGAAFAELYDGCRVILTPVPETRAEPLARISALWEGVGASVEIMDANVHDNILAATSHLPHMLAYTLVDCLAAMDCSGDIFRFAAGGFRDFTRIASSSPAMWHDIALGNREAVLAMLERFSAHTTALATAIATDDGDAVLAIFNRAKLARDNHGPEQRPEQL